MDCAQCGEANRDGARFCSGCGTPLARRCASCQAELRPTAKFCDECGTPVGNAAAPAAPSGPATAGTTATRKIVTALFADLVGSTSFGERADAEVARSVMARYHALLQEAVDAHGGTVAKFMGDGMMATFGIPEIAEDDALRAVRAGIDIQRRFTEFATQVVTQHGETLGLRVGVNTGEVVIASGDADLVGDALNVAARIEHACRPGQVTVGEETWRLTRGEFGYETLGEVTVAGRTQPVAIFEVAADTATTVVEMATPFVGRTPEMDRLRAVLGAAMDARAARLVTVLGSPGVGKTRLSRELCAATQADDGAVTFEIRCDRAGDSTFAPIAQLIRDATDLGDDTDAASARERLGALLADDEADRDRLVDILGGLVGAAPSRSVEETFWAVRRLVSATAADRPMVVVIDDIQWAEPLLLDLLEHLAEWVQDVPLLLLCLARPELREVRPSLAERNRRVEDVLALDGLDSAATEALAAGLLGTDRLPAGLVERLPTSTDGNPLFVRELVRMLVDDKVIRRNGDEWELAIDAEAVEVPPTIQSLLAARVERLPGDERAVLELAAVIGSEFNLGALRELAGADTPLPSLLESMRRKELVEPTGAYWGDEPVHRFHHVLIRDATYRRLLKTTRADLHEKVAVWTDAAAVGLIGEHEAVIAFHYEQAFRYRSELGSVDDHVTGLGRRAAELLSAASDRALGQDDLASAGALARRALALLPGTDGAARAELLTTACECTLASGDVVGARPVVEQLRAEAGDDPTLGAWAACFEAQLVGLTDPEGLFGAEATATGAAKVLEELQDGAGEAKAHQVRAGLLARLGRVGDAELELDLALGAARRVDDRRRVTAVLGAAPLAALWGPSPVARAGGRCLDVVRLLRITTASPSVEATSMRCQAVLEALRGRFDVARSMLDSSRATLEELGLRHGLLETAYLTGVVELIAGDPAAAIAPLHDAYDGLIEMGVGIDAGRAAALLAHALVAEGRLDDGEPMAAASEELAGQDLKTAIAWRVARAEVLAARGDVGGGIALAKEAVEIAAATDLVIDHADACVALASLHAIAGDAAATRSVRAEAKRLYDLKGATVPSERLADDAVASPAPIPAATRAPASAPDDTGPRHPRAENIATQVGSELWKPLLSGDLERYRRLVTDDVVTLDRRSLIGADLVGVDAMLANVRATAEMGAIDVHFEPLAVRGSVLGLGRVTFDFGGFESCFLALGEVTGDGRLAHGTMFDDDALADALDELDARYFAGEGATVASLNRVGFRAFAAANARDWDAYRETYSPNLICIDRRQIGWPTLDRDGLVETIRQYTEIAPDLILLPRKVHIEGPAALWTIDASGTTPDGGAVEWVQYTVGVAGPSGATRLEVFDEDDFAAALARLDELGAADAIETRTPDAENDAATLLAKAWDLIVTDRVDEIGPMCADDAVVIDGQRIVGEDLVGRDAIVANGRAVAALGADAASVEPLAVRGSRHALCRTTVSFGGFENVFLSVGELDAQGLARCIVTFNEDDLADALDELDARYVAAEDIPHAEQLRAAAEHNRAFLDRDWNRLAATLTDDLVVVDHRGLWPATDRAGYVARMQSLAATAGNSVIVPRNLHVTGAAAISTLEVHGTTDRGVAIQYAFHGVFMYDGGFNRIEYFADDQWDAALARLDELGASEPTETRTPDAINAAVDAILEIGAQLGRWSEITDRFTPDVTIHDRRRLVGSGRATGRDEVLAADAASGAVGLDTPIERSVIAIRGDRLALVEGGTATVDGLESVFLTLLELDEAGRVTAIDLVDKADLVPALDELDARYFAGEGAGGVPFSDFPVVNLVNRRDWSTLLDPGFPEFTQVDHRQLGWPTVDRQSWVATMQQYVELVPDLVMVVRKFHTRGNATLTTLDPIGTTSDGSAVAWSVHTVMAEDPYGVIRMEAFDLDDFAAALARLDELGAAAPTDTRHPRAENTATRTRRQVLALFNTGRFDEARALLTDDLERVDVRTVVSMPTTRGLDDFVEASRASLEAGFTRQSHVPIAVRGDRLELSRVTLSSADGNELVFLSIIEIDESGRVRGTTSFDEDALAEAQAELDQRYLVGEGAPHARELAVGLATWSAFRAREYDAVGELLAPNLVTVDHQRIGFGARDRDGFVAGMRQDDGLIVPVREIIRTGFLAPNAMVFVRESTRADAQGGIFEWPSVVLLTVDGTDRIDRIEWFDLEDWDAALVRLDELGAADPVDPRHPRAENTATRARARVLELLNAGRFETVGTLLTEDFERVDRRTVVSMPTARGRDAFVESSRATFDAGFTHISYEPIAVRGDRLELSRVTMRAADGHEMVFLNIGAVDETGGASSTTSFDEDALDDAVAELDARYVAGEGAPYAPMLEMGIHTLASLQAEDWTTLTAMLTDDYTFVDHRQLSNPSLDREGYVAIQQMFAEQIRRRMVVRTFHPVEHAFLCTFDVTGTDAGGGAFEWVFHLVSTVDEGRIAASELFDEDDFAAALARLDEIGSRPADARHPRAESTLTRNVDRFFALAVVGRFDDAAEHLASNLVRVDHRTSVSDATAHGRDEYMAALRSAFDVGFTGVTIDHLAVRGERLNVMRTTFVTEGGMQLPILSVCEADFDGLVSRISLYDDDAFDDAVAELESRHLAGEGEPDSERADTRRPSLENAATRWTRRLNELLNGGSPDEVAEMYAVDVVAIDRRTTVSLPTLRGRTAIRDNVQALRDVGFNGIRSEVLAVRGDGLVLQRVVFSTADGREMTTLGLNEWDNGEVVRRVVFDEDALDEAFADLDERYYAGEGVHHAPLLRVGARFIADLNAQDWTGVAAVLADDFSFTDHGQVGWPQLNRSEFLAMQQSYLDQIQQRFAVRAVHAGGRAVLSTIEIEGVDANGGTFEWSFHTVAVFDAERRVELMESYAEADLTTALARLDELGAATEESAPPTASHSPLANAVTRAVTASLAHCAAGNFDIDEFIAADILELDWRRTVSRPTLLGRVAFIENMRALYDVFDSVSFEPIAIRGDRLALIRVTLGRDGFATSMPGLYEADVHGRICWGTSFDEDGVATAIAELDARYLAGEGAAHAEMLEWMAEVAGAMRAREPGAEAVRALMAPDFALVDHRTLGYGAIDLPTLSTLQEARDEQVTDDRKFHRTREIKGDVLLAWYETQASAPDGGQFAWSHWVVWQRVGGLWARLEMFDLDDEAAARARFEELAAEPAHPAPELMNTATRVLLAAVARWDAGDLDFDDSIAEDIVRFDRRRSVATPTLRGRNAYIDNVKAIYDVFDALVLEPIAIRGDRVALFRVTLSHEGFTATMLGVYETDDRGLIVRGTSFDEEDLGRALDELEDRFIAGEGADHDYMIRRAGDVRRGAFATDPAAAYQALHTPDCVVTDHRLPSWPTATVTDVVDQVRADRGISSPRTTVFATLEVLGDAVLVTQDDHFVTPEGSEYLERSLAITHSVAGLVDSLDFFEPEQHEAARTRFEDLGSETRTPHVDNAVVRLLARGTWLGRFVPGHDAFSGLAEDLVVVDNRSGVSLPDLHGADELVQASREQEELFGPIEIEPVAVRGDRLALLHTRAVAPSGFETVGYGIFEIDEAGLQNAMTFFDDDDLLTAIDTLDARYADIAGPERAPGQAALLDGVGQLNRQDWDGFAILLHPDLEAVDHSPLGFPTTGRDGFVKDQMRGMAELVPDFVVVVRKILVEGRATLAVGTTLGTTVDGNAYAWEFIQVFLTDADGRGRHRDLYADTQWTEALARFDELASEDGVATEPENRRHTATESAGENRATRAGRRSIDAFVRGDRDAAIDAFAPAFTRSDQRRGPTIGDVVGREEYVDATLAGAEVGMAQFELTPLEIVGDDRALATVRWHNGDGFELEWLLVTEVDADGRILRVTNFDVDERDAASAALHEWATEAPHVSARMLEASSVRMDALARGDRDAVLATYTADFVREDRRRGINFGSSNREETVDALLAGNDVGLGNRTFTTVEAIGDHFALGEFRMSHDDGFELVYLLAVEQDDEGRLRRATNFDLGDRELAFALLREWAAERG